MSFMVRAALVAAFLLPSAAIAEAPKTYVLSAPLIEEIFQRLIKEPYCESISIAAAKLQAEVQNQPKPAPPSVDKK